MAAVVPAIPAPMISALTFFMVNVSVSVCCSPNRSARALGYARDCQFTGRGSVAADVGSRASALARCCRTVPGPFLLILDRAPFRQFGDLGRDLAGLVPLPPDVDTRHLSAGHLVEKAAHPGDLGGEQGEVVVPFGEQQLGHLDRDPLVLRVLLGE